MLDQDMEDFPADSKPGSPSYDDDDEFYEQIEAPKFFDLTTPDKYRPSDSSWFCLRVGCDQKHKEEEMDPETLHRNFVLRVMAARSPNVRLRNTLSRQALSSIPKCPLSAPAKSARDRISRLNMITSIAPKVGETRLKVPHLSKFRLTPNNANAKQSSATSKALTTPRNKMVRPNPELFRSVQGSKSSAVRSKSRMVAKALVFHSPKKSEKAELLKSQKNSTPDFCSEMKKLQISSKIKPARGTEHNQDCSKPAPKPAKSHLPRKQHPQLQQISSVSRDNKHRETPINHDEMRNGDVQNCHGSVLKVVSDTCDMKEVDGKSRDDSPVVSSAPSNSRIGGNEREDNPTSTANSGDTCSTGGESLPSSDESLTRDSSLPNSEGNDLKGNDTLFQTSNPIDKNETREKAYKENTLGGTSISVPDTTTEEELVPSSEESPTRENCLSVSVKHLEEKDPTLCSLKREVYETEPVESADKENAYASDNNRDVKLNTNDSKKNILKLKGCESQRKANRSPGKTHQESSAAGPQGGKYKKMKSTNPKPFRLRTDERGILKEANLDRRMHLLDPSKEANSVARNGILLRRHEIEIQQNGKYRGQCKQDSGAQGDSQIELQKAADQAKLQKTRPRYLRSTKSSEPKMALRTQKQKLESKEQVTPKMQRSTMKSPSSRLVRLQREVASPSKLGKIKETATTPRPKEALCEAQAENSGSCTARSSSRGKWLQREGASPSRLGTIKEISTTSRLKETPCEAQGEISASANGRSSSRGRRPLTVPKEPNFQKIHVPNSCTKKSVNVVVA